MCKNIPKTISFSKKWRVNLIFAQVWGGVKYLITKFRGVHLVCRNFKGDREWIYKSLNVETETKSLWVSMLRPRPRLENFLFLLWNSRILLVSMSRPRLVNFYFFYEILFMSRLRLIETRKFCGCRDRDSSRLGNSLVVEAETHQDW